MQIDPNSAFNRRPQRSDWHTLVAEYLTMGSGQSRAHAQRLPTASWGFLGRGRQVQVGVSFVGNWYPLFIPSLELCIPFNCCKFTFPLNINLKNHKTRKLSRIKSFCSPFWSLWSFYGPKTDFPTLSHTSTSESPTLSCTWSLKKILLSGVNLPVNATIGRNSPGKRIQPC